MNDCVLNTVSLNLWLTNMPKVSSQGVLLTGSLASYFSMSREFLSSPGMEVPLHSEMWSLTCIQGWMQEKTLSLDSANNYINWSWTHSSSISSVSYLNILTNFWWFHAKLSVASSDLWAKYASWPIVAELREIQDVWWCTPWMASFIYSSTGQACPSAQTWNVFELALFWSAYLLRIN